MNQATWKVAAFLLCCLPAPLLSTDNFAADRPLDFAEEQPLLAKHEKTNAKQPRRVDRPLLKRISVESDFMSMQLSRRRSHHSSRIS